MKTLKEQHPIVLAFAIIGICAVLYFLLPGSISATQRNNSGRFYSGHHLAPSVKRSKPRRNRRHNRNRKQQS